MDTNREIYNGHFPPFEKTDFDPLRSYPVIGHAA